MNWLVFALLAVITGATRQILEKKALQKEHVLEYLAVRSIFILFLLFFLIPFVDFNIHWKGYAIMGIVALIGSYGIVYFRKGLRHLDLSIVDPLMNIHTLMVLLIAFFFLGETITIIQLMGILLLIFGTYVLEMDHEHHGFFGPFKKMIESKYTLMIFLAAFIFAITNTLDKYVITNYATPMSYLVITWFFISILLITFHGISFQWKGIGKAIKTQGELVFWPALLSLVMIACFYQALALSTSTALVVAVFRVRTLITTIEGGKFFHENQLLKKSLACLIMMAGALMILL